MSYHFRVRREIPHRVPCANPLVKVRQYKNIAADITYRMIIRVVVMQRFNGN